MSGIPPTTALRSLVAANGLVFLLRAFTNLVHPTSFYLDEDAPANAKDAIHALGITQASLGLAQIGVARSTDPRAIRSLSTASLLFAAAHALKAATMSTDPSDAFHRLRIGVVAENTGVALLFGWLLARERRAA